MRRSLAQIEAAKRVPGSTRPWYAVHDVPDATTVADVRHRLSGGEDGYPALVLFREACDAEGGLPPSTAKPVCAVTEREEQDLDRANLQFSMRVDKLQHGSDLEVHDNASLLMPQSKFRAGLFQPDAMWCESPESQSSCM